MAMNSNNNPVQRPVARPASRRTVLKQWCAIAMAGSTFAARHAHGFQAPQLPNAGLTDSGQSESEGEPKNSRLTYIEPKSQRYRCGLELDTAAANCRGIITTFPLLRVWPEQEIELLAADVDPVFGRWQTRDLDQLVTQFVSGIPALTANTQASALFTYNVTRYRIAPPEKTDDLVIPRKLSRDLRQFLASSPYIEPGSARIRAAVREIEEIPAGTPWQRVETIYDYVREKITYVEGDIKSADEALKDGTGDCEELTSAFVAICRTMRIPARMVHVLMHCYPEFYLEDADGNGYWFPCQAAGTRQFGCMEEYRPILQKGDRFKTPEQSIRRYVAEFFKADKVQGGKPKPKFVQELLD